MGAVIGAPIPPAVGVAISPIPIVASILMLLARQARVSSIAFAVGWVCGIVVATAIFVFVGGSVQTHGTSTVIAWIAVVLGIGLLCIAAGVAVGSAGMSVGQTVACVAVFAVLGAISVLVSVVAYQVAAAQLRSPLDHLKTWLEANNRAVMATLLLVIGAVLIGKGICAS